MSFASTNASCPACQAWENTSFTKSGGGGGAAGRQPPIEPVQRVRIVLFFDGTFNNKFNTAARKAGSIQSPTGSYAGDETNIARMSEKLVPSGSYQGKSYDVVIPIYIEGIGTTTLDSDSGVGGGLGTESTGVVEKVESGVTKAIDRLMGRPASIRFEVIHFDTFGFSRGAAAARNAVYRILSGRIVPVGGTYYELPSARKKLTDAGRKISELKVRFVGLYDTVASLGVIHKFNTRELKLDSISNADQVIHLAAADEHRKNFRLTNTSSKKGGNSFEMFLPGAHADIGGGYNDGETMHYVLWTKSTLKLFSTEGAEKEMAAELAWLRSQGWFTGPGNYLRSGGFPNYTHNVHYVAGRQTTASNQYCFIPLNIMARRAGEQNLTFANLQRVTNSELLLVQSALRLYENAKRHSSSPFDWFHKTRTTYIPDLPGLRSRHLHFSSRVQDLAVEVDMKSVVLDGMLESMGPEYVNGRRERIIQNG